MGSNNRGEGEEQGLDFTERGHFFHAVNLHVNIFFQPVVFVMRTFTQNMNITKKEDPSN